MLADSTITCPDCGTAKTETMPTDACQYFYECTGCGTLLRPKPGDCCVFCSYGSVPCPPIQAGDTPTCGAYRGFGSDVANFVLERMADAAVAELNDDPLQFRRRNFIQPDQFPYLIPTGNMYDSGNYPAVLDKALGLLDYGEWRKRQEEARQNGRYIGIGVATCQERSVFSATEFWMLNEEPG